MKVFVTSWKWGKVPSKGGKIYCIGRNKTGTKSLSKALIQDVPFSLPYTYVVMDQYFPRSKFILTVRYGSE